MKDDMQGFDENIEAEKRIEELQHMRRTLAEQIKRERARETFYRYLLQAIELNASDIEAGVEIAFLQLCSDESDKELWGKYSALLDKIKRAIDSEVDKRNELGD
jgi:hypothetical protein